MNYYPHHIGDFNNATRHLSRIERSLYRDMIELYYDSESPLTLDRASLCRKLMARTEEESTAVEQVLKEFFTETLQGWYHSRCETEITQYHKSISDKSAAGKASAAKREAERIAKLNENSTAVEHPLDSVDIPVQLTKNQEPRTSNQEPIKTKTAPQAASAKARKSDDADFLLSLESEGVALDVAKDWLKVRKAKRLASTATALKGFIAEASKAGLSVPDAVQLCCVRGWGGLDADWLKPKSQGSPINQKPSRHSGFEKLDYGEGIENGRIT